MKYFLRTGFPVEVMHGANAPLLQRMIEKEMRKERLVLKGEAVRELIDLEDAVPGILISRFFKATF